VCSRRDRYHSNSRGSGRDRKTHGHYYMAANLSAP
jgi:hypothetical protein